MPHTLFAWNLTLEFRLLSLSNPKLCQCQQSKETWHMTRNGSNIRSENRLFIESNRKPCWKLGQQSQDYGMRSTFGVVSGWKAIYALLFALPAVRIKRMCFRFAMGLVHSQFHPRGQWMFWAASVIEAGQGMLLNFKPEQRPRTWRVLTEGIGNSIEL